MSPYITTLLLLTLGLGTTMTFASSHWLLAWMGLEINTLAIIPLMSKHHHPRAVEATTKYFLTQATAAATLLFASTTNAWLTGHWDIYLMSHPIPTTMVLLALSLKIGLAPLHTWLPEVLQGLDLLTGLILSTWQKLAPLALILQVPFQDQELVTILALLSTLVGGWGGLNQTQLRKILAYSSIAHLGWMMIVIQFSPQLTLLALTMYLVMTTATFLMLATNKTTTINELGTSWAKTPVLSTIAPAILLSLGGLPPLAGFMPKWLILQELTKQGLPALATLAALSALLSLFFYLRLCYSMTFTMSPNNTSNIPTWRASPQRATLFLPLSATLTTLLLPTAPILVAVMQL
uniref:NADH-ubiquinone oxidoreductase chain 2 n=1 Tax=Schismatogobius ampluvinculus TaxID=1916784 RepID=A0A347Z7I1_9GOBI|nr:NADH dehydrogenase subunit 2 [Schismatogobius ampluvinculus]